MPKQKKSPNRAEVSRSQKAVPEIKEKVVNQPTVAGRTIFYVAAVAILLVGAIVLLPNRTAAPTNQSTLQTTVTYRGVEDQSALALLKANHQVESQSFDIGEFVTAIDGLTAPTGYFWSFSVNGQLAEVGADQYLTKNGDTITWQLEKIQ